jgi:hypothetical protein
MRGGGLFDDVPEAPKTEGADGVLGMGSLVWANARLGHSEWCMTIPTFEQLARNEFLKR